MEDSRVNLSKYFSPSYFLDFAVFLKLNNDENDTIKNLIAQILRLNIMLMEIWLEYGIPPLLKTINGKT